MEKTREEERYDKMNSVHLLYGKVQSVVTFLQELSLST
jgi:hypothetical protein